MQPDMHDESFPWLFAKLSAVADGSAEDLMPFESWPVVWQDDQGVQRLTSEHQNGHTGPTALFIDDFEGASALLQRSHTSVLHLLRYVDGTMPEWSNFAHQTFILDVVDALLRGSSQVMLANNPIAGALAIAAIFTSNVWVACMACFGLLCSTGAAYAIGVNRVALQCGLFGYNGMLTGMALAGLMPGLQWQPLALVVNLLFLAVS